MATAPAEICHPPPPVPTWSRGLQRLPTSAVECSIGFTIGFQITEKAPTIDHEGRAAIRHYANQTALLTFASTSQFHVYLPWGQRPFSIVFFVFKESLEEKGCSPSLWIPNVQFAARKCSTHFAILHCAGTLVTPATTDNTSLQWWTNAFY